MTHRPHRPADQPRRRPRQGDGRGEVRRRVPRPGPRLRLGRLQPHRPGEDHLDRREPRRSKLARRDPGLHAREHARACAWFDSQLPRRGRAARLAVPPALRRRDPVQRPAGRPGRRRLASSWRATPRRWSGSSTRRAPHATDLHGQPGDGAHAEGAGAASSRRRSRAATPTRPSPTAAGAGRRGVRGAGRAPQPDGDVRDDGGPGRGRHAHRLRQDAGRAERPRLPLQRVRLSSRTSCASSPPFVGGAFGSGLRPQYQVFLAVLAARELKRSGPGGADAPADVQPRPPPDDLAARGARRRPPTARSQAVIHEAIAETSRYEDYSEEVVNWSGLLYRCDNVTARAQGRPARPAHAVRHAGARGASGACTRSRCAMDELAVSARHRPGRAAAEELRRGGPERRQAVLEQGAPRVLPPGRPSGSAGRGATPSPRSMRRGRRR